MSLDVLQIESESLFHFNLYIPVAGIYIVELLLAGFTQIFFDFRI